ncbi:MAG: cytochrome P450 [Burkholderiales bacterium]
MGNGLHALMTHSDQLKHLVAQSELIASAVEELLRFESPLKLNNRIASVDMKIAGHFMPAGTFITLGVGAANRDPAQFARLEQLDIARKPNRHLAFGHGDHACAGMNVARLGARIGIGRLGKYPLAKPGALSCKPLKAAWRGR